MSIKPPQNLQVSETQQSGQSKRKSLKEFLVTLMTACIRKYLGNMQQKVPQAAPNQVVDPQIRSGRSAPELPLASPKSQPLLVRYMQGTQKPKSQKLLNSQSEKELEKLKLYSSSKGELVIKPNPGCFRYDVETHTCWLNRQIGSTLNLEPEVYNRHTGKRANLEDVTILWQRGRKMFNKNSVVMENIGEDVSQSNIVVGNDGQALRLSPLLEEDMDYNNFKLVILSSDSTSEMEEKMNKTYVAATLLAKMIFRILIVPINMGTLYAGENLVISIDRHISIPAEKSVYFHWYVEKGLRKRSTLPPNMVVSKDGRMLSITELQANKPWMIACSMFDKKTGNFYAKRRFFFRVPVIHWEQKV